MPGWIIMNFYSIFICVFLFMFNKRHCLRNSRKTELFEKMTALLIVLLVSDSFGRFARTDTLQILLSDLGNEVVFALDPIMGIFMFKYLESLTNKKTKVQTVLHYLIYAIVVSNTIIIILSSLFSSRLFYYYENNVYHRGPLFVARALIVLSVSLLLFVYVLIMRKHIERRYVKIAHVFSLSPTFFGILQVFIPDYATEYAGMTLILFMMFIYMQNLDAREDYLTNTLNRRFFDDIITEKIETFEKSGKSFTAFMFDIDKFKSINDLYGHDEGDEVLVVVSNILKRTFKKNGNVCRFGGDEFYVVSEISTNEEIRNSLEKIQLEIDNFNSKNEAFALSVSSGYKTYENSDKNAENFLKNIDKLMYDEKDMHHKMYS